MISSSIRKGAFIVYLERIVLVIFSFFITALLVRFLSITDFGLYRLIVSLLVASTYVTSFGLEISISRFIPEFIAKKNYKNIINIINLSLLIRGLGLCCVFFIFILFSANLGEILKAEIIFDNFLTLVIPYFFFHLINGIIGRSYLVAYSMRYVVGYVQMASKLIQLIMVVILYLGQKTLKEAVLVLLLITIFEFGIYLVLFIKKTVKNITLSLDIKQEETFPIKRVMRFSGFNFLFSSGYVFREYAVDNFIIAYYMNPISVAYYSIATVVPVLIRNFSPGKMLFGVLLPELVAKYEESNSYRDIIRVYEILQKINLLLLPIIIFLFIYSGELIRVIYGDGYSISTTAAQILIMSSFLLMLSDPFYLVAQVLEKPNIIFYSTIWAIFNVTLNFILIPKYGIIGAAIATSSASLCTFLYFYYIFKNICHINLHYPWLSLFKNIINMSPSVVIFSFARQIDLALIFEILLVTFGFILYLALLSYNKLFSLDEREYLLHKTNTSILKPFI